MMQAPNPHLLSHSHAPLFSRLLAATLALTTGCGGVISLTSCETYPHRQGQTRKPIFV